jgi:hypothetical protein
MGASVLAFGFVDEMESNAVIISIAIALRFIQGK